MVHYRRNRVKGGTYFFTATLRNRNSSLLTDHVDILRKASENTKIKSLLKSFLLAKKVLCWQKKVSDGPYSSFHRYLKEEKLGLNWAGERVTSADIGFGE